jgi:hypothetical protein
MGTNGPSAHSIFVWDCVEKGTRNGGEFIHANPQKEKIHTDFFPVFSACPS